MENASFLLGSALSPGATVTLTTPVAVWRPFLPSGLPLAFQFEMTVFNQPKVKGYKPNLLGKPKYEFISLG